jgi:hypothetical protein
LRDLITCPDGIHRDWEYFQISSQAKVEFEVDDQGLAEAIFAVSFDVL